MQVLTIHAKVILFMFLPLLYNKFCNRHTDTVCYSLYFFLSFYYFCIQQP